MTARETAGSVPTTVIALDEASPRYPGWPVVAACFAMATYAWGFGFYGHGFYFAALQRMHGWPASAIAGGTTGFYLFSAVLGAFTGDLITRCGARAVAVTGIALTALAASLIPFVSAPWHLYAAYGLMAFGWAATSLTAVTTIIGLWFSTKRGLAISIGLTGASFGGILIVPLLAYASERFGFGPAVWSVAVCLGVPTALAAFSCFGGAPPYAGQRSVASTVSASVSRKTLLRSAAFWSISAPFAIAFFAQVGFLVHQIAMLEPATGRATAGVAVAVTTASAVGGRLVLGAVIDRLDQRLVTALSFLSQGMALLVVWAARDPVILIAACAVFGFSVGNVITLPALIIGRDFPARDFAMVVGMSNAVCQIAYAFGPGLLGALRDGTGSYDAPLLLCLSLDVIAGLAIVCLPRLCTKTATTR